MVSPKRYAWGFRVGFLTYGIKTAAATLQSHGSENRRRRQGQYLQYLPPRSILVLKASIPTYREEKTECQKNKERFLVTKEILAAHPIQRFFRTAAL